MRATTKPVLALVLGLFGCMAAETGGGAPGPTAGSGGRMTGGSGGSGGGAGTSSGAGGTGSGMSTAGSGGASGGAGGSGGASGSSGGAAGTGGSEGGQAGAPAADAFAPEAAGDAAAGPTAPGQGPSAEGRIVYSQDFEQGMEGITRSPGGLPADRARIADDPLGQRGKVMRVEWRSGDNFRTSGGTEPRSWISNRAGHEFRPGTNVSHAFGFMMSSADTEYSFAQIISSGGPVWMLTVTGQNTLGMLCSCGNSQHMQLQPNRWYDFRVDMDFRAGGAVRFYLDGQMFKQGTISGTRGDIAHWDGGIYNRAAGTQANRTRVVYISNLSVGVR